MKKNTLYYLRETAETIVIAFVLAFLVRSFIAQSFWIPSGSMEPTLQIGNRIMAYKLLYGLRSVKRGDVIVFKYPLNPRKDFVKRVIGLPGDKIEIKNKKIYVNRKLLTEPYAVHSDPWTGGFPRDEYGPIQVPADSLFVLGDNRDTSADSRYWGFVPGNNIIARTFFVYWPLWRMKIIKRPIY